MMVAIRSGSPPPKTGKPGGVQVQNRVFVSGAPLRFHFKLSLLKCQFTINELLKDERRFRGHTVARHNHLPSALTTNSRQTSPGVM